MESTFALSPSIPFLKSRNPNLNLRFNYLNLSSNPSFNLNSVNGVSSYSSSSLQFSSWCYFPCIVNDRRRMEKFNVKATLASHDTNEEEVERPSTTSTLIKTLELGVLIGLWYILTIMFNIYNKQVLTVYPFPLTISTLHFGMGTVIVLLMWTFNLHKKPKISRSQLLAIIPLAIAHTLGNLFTNMSLGKVSVSFTHTIKAMEPFFSVVLSAMFLGEIPTFWVVSSLLPVVGGVALASFTEVSFNWIGFSTAMASNLTNQSRNVLSKKFMIKKEGEYLDNVTLLSIITIMSFILMAPVSLLIEGFRFTPAGLLSSGLDVKDIYVKTFVAGLFYHAYQQVSSCF
ncbi:hypothetical protein AQUCO_00200108v1 [Aquilegia coerulea]|uniref:Sugar phosphate transporter domain-containing protein n=1 Tax=Aquilegia coerulea TaxID=218851 RepID=A0A2G5F1W8_AQUCA|nr:hypothetical protein AQUCO_00200108v1 [Aquilegia coerulea]